MNWWSWGILGFALLGLELFAIDAQFFLVFAGVAAIVVGLLGLLGIDLPQWAQWIAFAILALVAMFTIRRQVYEKLLSKPGGKVNSDIHQHVVIAQALEPGKSARIEYRGTGWTAINVGKESIQAGGEARIESIDGLTLHVRAL
jgi:membrane protein implicated in regulation of membrane protease activity